MARGRCGSSSIATRPWALSATRGCMFVWLDRANRERGSPIRGFASFTLEVCPVAAVLMRRLSLPILGVGLFRFVGHGLGRWRNFQPRYIKIEGTPAGPTWALSVA